MSLPRYEKYKDSGVEWLGEVPVHWEVKPLWAFFRRVKRTGFDDEQLLSVYRDYGVIPKASRDDNFNKPSDDLSVYQLVIPGDLAINKMKAWQGSVAISDYRGIVSPAYFVYESLHNQNSRYLHYLMRSLHYIGAYLSVSKGIRPNQWDLEPQLHSRMPLLVPSADEQTHIATFLDQETGKIDELVAEQRRLMELLKEKRQTVISHAVTKGLNPDAPMKPSGIEWLGDLPKHWKVIKLGLISTFKGGAGFPIDYQGQTENEIPFFKVGDIVNSDESGVMRQANHTITRESAKTLRAFIFPSDTIVFAKVGAALLLKRFRELGQSSCIDNNMMGMTAGKKVSADFLLYVLPLLDFTLIVSPGAVPSMNEGQISGQRIALPPLEEQTVIIEYLNAETTKFDILTTEANRAIALLQERRSALISAAVTGQIDVRHAGDTFVA